MSFEERIETFFGDEEPSGFGTGWWSGVLSVFFGLLGCGAVLCLHYPQLLTYPDLRPHYPMAYMRLFIQGVIGAAFLFGVVSSLLRKKKTLGLTGALLAMVATLFGGASVPINESLHAGPAIGLDWFLLDLLMMSLIYVPLERLWPQYPKQGTFRKEWTLDVVYFLSTHLPIQILSFLFVLPATMATKWFALSSTESLLSQLPWVVQFLLAILIADLAQYAIHRTFHKVPFLWRFHAIHHNAQALDWIAGSRSHFVDVVVVRTTILTPLMVLGFSQSVVVAYLVFVTIHATLEHANFSPDPAWIENWIVLPRHHHWHHASHDEAIDKDFAIHFPWIDRLFGTHYSPEGLWPERYGLAHAKIPKTFVGQFFGPFIGKG